MRTVAQVVVGARAAAERSLPHRRCRCISKLARNQMVSPHGYVCQRLSALLCIVVVCFRRLLRQCGPMYILVGIWPLCGRWGYADLRHRRRTLPRCVRPVGVLLGALIIIMGSLTWVTVVGDMAVNYVSISLILSDRLTV